MDDYSLPFDHFKGVFSLPTFMAYVLDMLYLLWCCQLDVSGFLIAVMESDHELPTLSSKEY